MLPVSANEYGRQRREKTERRLGTQNTDSQSPVVRSQIWHDADRPPKDGRREPGHVGDLHTHTPCGNQLTVDRDPERRRSRLKNRPGCGIDIGQITDPTF